jgi:16S rRNA processing protein RimM
MSPGVDSSGDPAWPDDAVEVGRIIGPWGVKGAFKVMPYAADPKALFSSRRWFLQADEAHRGPPLPRLFKITEARAHGEGVVASAQEVPDRTAAEALKNVRVFVSRGSFPTAAADEYYWVDLIGLEVVNREGIVLGSVTDLISTGPHSVLRVRRPGAGEAAPPDEAECLIPFVGAYIDGVSLAERRITVDWGLDY